MFIAENVKIRTVERAGAIDRYGEPSYDTIYENIGGYIERGQFMTRGLDGDTKTADGTFLADPVYKIRTGDKLVLDSEQPERYLVYRAEESLDAMGLQQARMFILTKLEDEI